MTDREEQLRRQIGNVPRRVQRQLDRWRVARGMTPLWTTRATGSSRPPKERS